MRASKLPQLPNKHSIRVISLAQPHEPDAPLEASIHVIDLNDEERAEYVCLSYTWGPPTPNTGPHYSITINGAVHSIRENLNNALRRLRDRIGSHPIWIDALSIAQDDLKEKADQVAMIARIFSSASEVLAWLGEHADGSDRILPAKNVSAPFAEDMSGQIGHLDLLRLSGQLPLDDAESDAWIKLFERAYWTRTWIVQEVVSAQRLTVLCGQTASSWKTVHDHARILTQGCRKEPTGNTEWRVRELNFFRERRRDATLSLPFKDVISAVVGTSCADRRDRVYAILSLDDEWHLRDHIQPDYSISVQDLFAKLLKTIGMFDSNEAILLGSSFHTALQISPTELEHAMSRFLTMPADEGFLLTTDGSHVEGADQPSTPDAG